MTRKLQLIEHDWYRGNIPDNVEFDKDTYIDSSYGFVQFHSRKQPGLIIGQAAGVYNRTNFLVSQDGMIRIGAYSCLNEVFLICNELITIGDHCLLSWGVVVTDSHPGTFISIETRREALKVVNNRSDRWLPPLSKPKPVTIEDNVWVGFDSVVLPGVCLGRGCVVGCKSIISQNIPPYAVAVGNPARVVRYLTPNDSAEARTAALEQYTHK